MFVFAFVCFNQTYDEVLDRVRYFIDLSYTGLMSSHSESAEKLSMDLEEGMTAGHTGGGHHSPSGSSGGLAISAVQPRVYFDVETPPSGRLSPALGGIGMKIGGGGGGGEGDYDEERVAGGAQLDDDDGDDGDVQMDPVEIRAEVIGEPEPVDDARLSFSQQSLADEPALPESTRISLGASGSSTARRSSYDARTSSMRLSDESESTLVHRVRHSHSSTGGAGMEPLGPPPEYVPARNVPMRVLFPLIARNWHLLGLAIALVFAIALWIFIDSIVDN